MSSYKIDDYDFESFIYFKVFSFKEYQNNKISPIEFANRTYFFTRQNRGMKVVKKAHDIKSILFNYFYWTARIERHSIIERQLQKYGCASAEILNHILATYIRRRNQMIGRLFREFRDEIKIRECKNIYEDIVELHIDYTNKESGEWENLQLPIFCQREVLERLKVHIDFKIGKTDYKFYLPFIIYSMELDLLE